MMHEKGIIQESLLEVQQIGFSLWEQVEALTHSGCGKSRRNSAGRSKRQSNAFLHGPRRSVDGGIANAQHILLSFASLQDHMNSTATALRHFRHE